MGPLCQGVPLDGRGRVFVAYFTEDDVLSVHVWAGYVVGGFVFLRVLWGFVGPRHARFTNFIYGPRSVLGYGLDLLRGRSKRYVGHSPAGGAMVVALMFFLAATVSTGLLVYAEEEGAGPLVPFFTEGARDGDGDDSGGSGKSRRRGRGGSDFDDVHEVLANITLALVFFHVLGVTAASFAHRENLVRSMITGRKRSED